MSGILKRALDVCVAAGGVVVLAPLFAVLAVLVTIDSRGPVWFRQWRIARPW